VLEADPDPAAASRDSADVTAGERPTAGTGD
jgi:hypothetical protein